MAKVKKNSKETPKDIKTDFSLVFAAISGFLASSASIFAKLAFDQDLLNKIIEFIFTLTNILNPLAEFKEYILYSFQGLGLLGMIGCNVLMLNFNSKTMDASDSSVNSIVKITSFNIFFSAIMAWICFNEVIGKQWFIGAFIILIGLFLVHSSSSQSKPKQD